MKKLIQQRSIKKIIQLLFFLFLPALFIQIYQSIKSIVIFLIHGEGRVESLVFPFIVVGTISLITIILGRFFCGWMCAFGTMGDVIFQLSHLKNNNYKQYLKNIDGILKNIKYVFLVFIVIFIWGFQLVSIPSGTNPWDLFGVMVSFGNWISLEEIISSWLVAAILLLGIIMGSIFVERFFCRYLCPLGAYFGIISRFRSLIIVKNKDNCGACSLCTSKCSMGIDLDHMNKVHSMECINCMECMISCPKKNAHMEFNGTRANAMIIGLSSCALLSGTYYLGNFIVQKSLESDSEIFNIDESIKGMASDLEDGIYQGTGIGFRGEIILNVTVENHMVTNIEIESSKDDVQYLDRASTVIISEIISNQSVDVDAVSGATYSSKGILEAVENAMNIQEENAEVETEETLIKETEETSIEETEEISIEETEVDKVLIDGIYQGSATGWNGLTSVEVTVENGDIKEIIVLSYEDDVQFFQKAQNTVINEILEEQSSNVDAVSGATYSSNSIINAVSDALGWEIKTTEIQRNNHR